MTTQRCPTGSMITSVGLSQEADGSMGIANIGCARTDLIAQSGMPPETTFSVTGFQPSRTLRCTNGKMGYGVQAGYDDSDVLVGMGLFCRDVVTGEVTDGAGTFQVAPAASWGRLWTVDRDDENKDLGLGAGMDGFVITRNGADAITGLRPLINIGNPGSNLIRRRVPPPPPPPASNFDAIGNAIQQGFDGVVRSFTTADGNPIPPNDNAMAIAAVVIGVLAMLAALLLLYLHKA